MVGAEYGGSLFQVYSVYDQTHDPSVSTWMRYQKATGIKNRKYHNNKNTNDFLRPNKTLNTYNSFHHSCFASGHSGNLTEAEALAV